MEDIVIVSAARTGVGKFGGSLAKVRADDLAAAHRDEPGVAVARAAVQFVLVPDEDASVAGGT